jgi:hypothetical protein
MRSLTKNMQASLMNLLPRLSSSVPCPGRRKWVLTAAAAASSSSSFHLLPFHRCDASPSSSSCSCSSSSAASFYLWTKNQPKTSRSQAFGAQDPQLQGNKYPSQQQKEVSGYPIQNPAHCIASRQNMYQKTTTDSLLLPILLILLSLCLLLQLPQLILSPALQILHSTY